jgi:hypothetical protein
MVFLDPPKDERRVARQEGRAQYYEGGGNFRSRVMMARVNGG